MSGLLNPGVRDDRWFLVSLHADPPRTARSRLGSLVFAHREDVAGFILYPPAE